MNDWWVEHKRRYTSSDWGQNKASISDVKPKLRDVLVHYGLDPGDIDVDFNQGSAWLSVHCPFHEDKNRSASVNLRELRFNCFVCLINGDVVDVVMDQEGFETVREAIEWIERV